MNTKKIRIYEAVVEFPKLEEQYVTLIIMAKNKKKAKKILNKKGIKYEQLYKKKEQTVEKKVRQNQTGCG